MRKQSDAGLVRLHVLHQAGDEELYGQRMIGELARHGYRLSPGTLYPILHAMERRGYLAGREERVRRSVRRLSRATPLGRAALREASQKILLDDPAGNPVELFEAPKK
jgi:PadR family transcriptional regulator PadR